VCAWTWHTSSGKAEHDQSAECPSVCVRALALGSFPVIAAGYRCRTTYSDTFAIVNARDAVNRVVYQTSVLVVLNISGVSSCRKQAVEDFLDEDELELARTTAVQVRALEKPCSWPRSLQCNQSHYCNGQAAESSNAVGNEGRKEPALCDRASWTFLSCSSVRRHCATLLILSY